MAQNGGVSPSLHSTSLSSAWSKAAPRSYHIPPLVDQEFCSTLGSQGTFPAEAEDHKYLVTVSYGLTGIWSVTQGTSYRGQRNGSNGQADSAWVLHPLPAASKG